MATPPTDIDLIARIGRRDKSALKILYDRHHDSLFRFALSHCKDAFEASDIIQETMLVVWQTADRFAGRSAVRSWMFGIARNKAIDNLRKMARTDVGTDTIEQVDESPDAQSIIVAAQNADQVRACLSKLSDSHRRVVHLAFFEDLPYSQIGEIEKCAVGTVKTRIHHAKKLLMRCLSRAFNS